MKAALVKQLGEEKAKPYVSVAPRVVPWIQDTGYGTDTKTAEALALIKPEDLSKSLDKLEPLLKKNPIEGWEFLNLVNALDIIGDRWEDVQKKLGYLRSTLSLNEKWGHGLTKLSLQILLCTDDQWKDIPARAQAIFSYPKLKRKEKTGLEVARVVEACRVRFNRWQESLDRCAPLIAKVKSAQDAALIIGHVGYLSSEDWAKAQGPLNQIQYDEDHWDLKVVQICKDAQKRP